MKSAIDEMQIELIVVNVVSSIFFKYGIPRDGKVTLILIYSTSILNKIFMN